MGIKDFEYRPLGEIIQFSRGFDITKKEQEEGLYPVVSSGGIASFNNKFKCAGEGVVTGRKGTLGKVFYVKSDYWPHDTTLWVKDFKGNNPRYIYYLLSKMQLEIFDVGSSNPTLNRNHLHKIQINFPKKRITQDKVADILSAYDDLIEVNNQRIKLLEETARELYKEWFVRMRFPGWKETKFVKGVPEGWEVKKLFDFADITYGFPFQSGLFNEIGHGLPVVRIRDILDSSTKTFTNEIANSKYYVTNGDILVGMDGDFHISKWSGGKAWLNQRVVRLRPKSIKDESLPFLFYAIKAPIEFLNSIIVGTTVAHLSDRDMKKILLLIPNASILKEFKEIADPLYELEVLLNEQNTQLRQIRDRLLPRLISGKLQIKEP